MQTEYTVTIRKEHCTGANFYDCFDCPLHRAIREQHPGFPIGSVGGTHVTVKGEHGRDITYWFDVSQWGYDAMSLLNKGLLGYVTVLITTERTFI